jgi:predicted regulator of Ras-like GTPase activity (Roadblock/LC7/MglB family)
MFRDTLQKMVDRLDGGVAGILMGFDGIAVEHYSREEQDGQDGIDIQTVGMELAHAVSQLRKAVERLDLGQAAEITVRTDKLVILVYVLSEEYFVACAVRPDASFGKARYVMRLVAPQIRADL